VNALAKVFIIRLGYLLYNVIYHVTIMIFRLTGWPQMS